MIRSRRPVRAFRPLVALAGCALMGLAGAAWAGPISPKLAGDPVFTPPPAKPGFAYPDCFCVNKGGERTPMGGTACIRVGSSEYTARCGMSLNNPAWRKLQDGCDPGVGASLLQRLQSLKPG